VSDESVSADGKALKNFWKLSKLIVKVLARANLQHG
jgi:hypothetical protein